MSGENQLEGPYKSGLMSFNPIQFQPILFRLLTNWTRHRFIPQQSQSFTISAPYKFIRFQLSTFGFALSSGSVYMKGFANKIQLKLPKI